MRNKAFIKICEGRLLRRSVVVCCGPKDRLKRLFFDPKGPFRNFRVGHPAHKETWKFLEGRWQNLIDEPDICALGFTASFRGDVFIVLPKWNPHVFVHEAYHATKAVLQTIGSDDEELGAYVIEWLFEELCQDKDLRHEG